MSSAGMMENDRQFAQASPQPEKQTLAFNILELSLFERNRLPCSMSA